MAAAVSVVSAVVAAARAEAPVAMTGADRVPRVVVPIAAEIVAVEAGIVVVLIVAVVAIATSVTGRVKTCRQPGSLQ